MLDTTRATEFIPGTNVRDEVTDANWSFLLPQLELGRVVCFGLPAPATLVTLAHRASNVMVICANIGQTQQLNQVCLRHRLSHVRRFDANGSDAPAFAEHSFDLALVTPQSGLARDRALVIELRRLLTPAGLVYAEFGGPIERLQSSAALKALANAFGTPQRFWLTPLRGEMHTAVPIDDHRTIAYFLRHQLYSSSVDLRTLKHAAQSLLRGRSAAVQPAHAAGQSDVAASAPPRLQAPRKTLDGLINRVQRTLYNAERLLSPLTRRYGVLAGRAVGPSDQPPLYLRMIAREAGVNIERCRWGLAARGEYSSRKVLLFLFDQDSESPAYIVKMTRDPALNPRLENERHALTLLHEKGIGDCETLPQVAFFGHHSDLAIVGETVVAGQPFEQQTSATADCPYARAAIDWLIDLGATTADTREASPFQVAEGLRSLFRRFTEIYQLAPEHHDFLSRQLACIGQSHSSFPLVFQHGDPGTWNVLVTPTGRIAFLDWEAAERAGMPLWDVFYLIRAYGVLASRRAGTRNMLQGFAEQFLHDTPLGMLLVDSTWRSVARIGLAPALIEPLFYTCWMHRALKEATRLEPACLEKGHYLNLLRLCIDQRHTPVLKRLFSSQLVG
jgi:Phosphotransferase enzyme family